MRGNSLPGKRRHPLKVLAISCAVLLLLAVLSVPAAAAVVGQGGGGYNYRFNEVVGFCHLHDWMTVGLDVMPTTGGDYKLNKDGWKSPFSRETEVVRPGSPTST